MIRYSNVILLVCLLLFSLFLGKKISNKITMYKNSLKKSSMAQINKRMFSSICQNVSLKNNMIEANCNNSGTFSLDLNKCLSNIDAKLIYRVNGGYYNSCNSCKINVITNADKSQNYSLSCLCGSSSGVYNKAEINLNNLLFFKNSFSLVCDDPSNFKVDYQFNNPNYLDQFCVSPKIVNQVIFSAVCNNLPINFDLNSCIGNFNGGLAFSENGKFGSTCSNCYVTPKNNIMITCDCKDMSQKVTSVEYPLYKFIEFSQDKIVCANKIILKPKIEVVEKLPFNRNLSAGDNFMIYCNNIQVQGENKLIASCGSKVIDEYEIDLDVC